MDKASPFRLCWLADLDNHDQADPHKHQDADDDTDPHAILACCDSASGTAVVDFRRHLKVDVVLTVVLTDVVVRCRGRC